MGFVLTYVLDNNLYVNVTNRCSNNCIFCIRNTQTGIKDGLDLWLDKEPSVEELLSSINQKDLSKYNELVFCGYGEPTYRIEDIVFIAKEVKNTSNIKIRINTNGHANLIHNKDITPLLKDCIDVVSISLNAKNKSEYNEICNSQFGIESFDGMLDFTSKCKKYVDKVILTIVDVLSPEDIRECSELANEVGVDFRVRKII